MTLKATAEVLCRPQPSMPVSRVVGLAAVDATDAAGSHLGSSRAARLYLALRQYERLLFRSSSYAVGMEAILELGCQIPHRTWWHLLQPPTPRLRLVRDDVWQQLPAAAPGVLEVSEPFAFSGNWSLTGVMQAHLLGSETG